MKRAATCEPAHTISSDDSSSSDSENDKTKSIQDIMAEGTLTQSAEMYQDYMKQIPIPSKRGSRIPFTSWQGLGRSVKQLYMQPLHYLTNVLLKQWDLSRVGSPDERLPLDTLIHPLKAEALIWVTEEVHRRTASHHQIAKLWASDPMYHANIDPIFTQETTIVA